MDFRYKCLLQTAFSLLPAGQQLNYLFQRYITKTLPSCKENFNVKIALADRHYDNFRKFSKTGTEDVYYEFGAGWDLINPISISLRGFKHLYCIDIRELIFPEILNNTVNNLIKPSLIKITRQNYRRLLQDNFRLTYIAPMDARATSIEENSVDFISSNLTYEHIPQKDIAAITSECYRILKPGGVMSCTIDYKDHWSYFDNSISHYNYLKYSDNAWRLYNPGLHYQNRLRHNDYMKIFYESNFEVVDENFEKATTADLQALQKVIGFVDNLDEIGIKSSWIVLRK